MMEREKIHSLHFYEDGSVSVNGKPPVKTKRADIDAATDSAELEKDCLAMAGLVNDRRKKENIEIKEV